MHFYVEGHIDKDSKSFDEQALRITTILYGFESLLSEQLRGEESQKNGGFNHISSAYSRITPAFMQAVDICIEDKISIPDFVDIGCGLGSKCALAALLGCRTTGIDINPKYVDFAAKLVDQLWDCGRRPMEDVDHEFITADVREYKGYGAFDILYWYAPLQHVDRQRELEVMILQEARFGALLIPAINLHFHISAQEAGVSVERISDYLYRKSS